MKDTVIDSHAGEVEEGLRLAATWLRQHRKGSTLDAATAAVMEIGNRCGGDGIGGNGWAEFLTAVRGAQK